MTAWKPPGKPPVNFPANYFAVVEELAQSPEGTVACLHWDYPFPEGAKIRANNFRYWRFCLRNHGDSGVCGRTETQYNIKSRVVRTVHDRWAVAISLSIKSEHNPALAGFIE